MSTEQTKRDLAAILMDWRDAGGPVEDVVLAIELLIREIVNEPLTYDNADTWPKCPTCGLPIYHGHTCTGIAPGTSQT